ncbi:ribokinase [Lacisediminihabitans profunda]|uniref:Ribokinase n=1 Tax=Lacisediminihabitans profunda TaxID=2594790 RepID=A0A5C8UV20_9MICO|nr:ribokinase [Lacisediminihabitans profunda]TXN31466.1 ribokinase [Lacisediminihabitans profunda]
MSRDSTTNSRSGVTVVGSANRDIVFTVERIPQPGETILAKSTAKYAGGKGLNQAVAAARAGAATTFIGALGRDEDGEALAGTLRDESIADHLVRRTDEPTGQAFIVVDGFGENTIIVASGANGSFSTVGSADREAIGAASVVLLQLELPLERVAEVAEAAGALGATVMLNAAPARALPRGLMASLDYLIVNEHEACAIGGSDRLDVASATLASLVGRVVVTLGSAGAVLYDRGAELVRVAAPRVTAVDTTGAGDTFCGAFAAAIADGREYEDAARFATAAAALSVQSIGAVPSIPFRAAIEEAGR